MYDGGSFGAHLDFYTLPLFGRRLLQQHKDVARSKSFMLRFGYLFSRTPSGSTDPLPSTLPQSRPIGGSISRGPCCYQIAIVWTFGWSDGDYQPR